MGDIIYEVNGKYWNVDQACYVDTIEEGSEVIVLFNNGKPADEESLIRTLQYYNMPLGHLVTEESKETLEERIARLEAELAELKAQAVQF